MVGNPGHYLQMKNTLNSIEGKASLLKLLQTSNNSSKKKQTQISQNNIHETAGLSSAAIG